MIILKILLWVIVCILLLLTVVMVIPLRVDMRYTDSAELTLKILFIKIKLFPTEEKPKKKAKDNKNKNKKAVNKKDNSSKENISSTEKPSEKEKSSKDEAKSSINKIRDLFKQRGLDGLINIIRELAGLVSGTLKPLFKHIKLKRLDIDVCVAKDNAADTAVHYGYVCSAVYPALSVLLNVIKFDDYNVNIYPDFDKKENEVKLDAEISVITAFAVFALIYALIQFIKLKVKGIL